MASRVVYRESGEPWFAIEVADDVPTPPYSPLRGGRVENVQASMREAGEIVAQTAKDILGPMQDALAEAAPGGVELTFGVKLGAEGSLPLIMKATGEATFEVKLRWTNAGK